MPDFVCNRTVVITKKGHSLVLRKGEPGHVPLELVQDAIALGAEPVDGDKDAYLPTEKTPEEQLSAADREALVFAAFDQIVGKNDTGDFGGDGKPTVDAVKKIVNFGVVKKEITTLFQKYRESKVGTGD